MGKYHGFIFSKNGVVDQGLFQDKSFLEICRPQKRGGRGAHEAGKFKANAYEEAVQLVRWFLAVSAGFCSAK